MLKHEILNGVIYSNKAGSTLRKVMNINTVSEMVVYSIIDKDTWNQVGDPIVLKLKSFASWADKKVEIPAEGISTNVQPVQQKDPTPPSQPELSLNDFNITNLKAKYLEAVKVNTLSTEQTIEAYVREVIDKSIREGKLFAEFYASKVDSWLDREKVLETMKSVLKNYGQFKVKAYDWSIRMFIYQSPAIINLVTASRIKGILEIDEVKETFKDINFFELNYTHTYSNVAMVRFLELDKEIDSMLKKLMKLVFDEVSRTRTSLFFYYSTLSPKFNKMPLLDKIYIDSKIQQFLMDNNIVIKESERLSSSNIRYDSSELSNKMSLTICW